MLASAPGFLNSEPVKEVKESVKSENYANCCISAVGPPNDGTKAVKRCMRDWRQRENRKELSKLL